MRRLLPALLLLAALLAGCRPPQASPGQPVLTAVTASATSPAAAATAAALPTAPAPTAAAVPATAVAAPAQAAATSPTAEILLPAAHWDDWATYFSALRPDQRPPITGTGQGAGVKDMTQYHLSVHLSAGLEVLQGAARIRYTNRSQDTLAVVYLHLFPNLWHDGMTVAGVQVDGRPAVTALEGEDSLLRIALPAPLAPGSVTELALHFAEPIPHRADVGNYGDFSYQDGVLALAQFYPTVVVYDATGWHLERPSEQGDVVFHDASLYDVTLTAPADMTVVATGQTIDRRDNGDDSATWHLAGGPMRDFNIVASAQFEHATQADGDVAVNSYFLPADRQGGRRVLSLAAAALDTYQREFGPYPYTELDVVETATTAGGIEYPGLVVIASSLYSDPVRNPFFEGATAHEVAHQWWYNVVGDDQVNTPWLDEAMAQYATYLYYQAAYGDQGAAGFEQSLRDRWQRVNNEDKPIGLPVADYQGAEYGAIVYGRGPLFLLAVQDKIGEDTMIKFLRQYYQAYAWRIATPAAFETLLEQVAGQDLSGLFATWVYPRQ